MSIYRLLYVKCKTYFYFHVFYKCSTCFYISLTFDSVSVVVSLLDLTVFVVFDMHINWCLFTISILWLLYDKCKTCYYYYVFSVWVSLKKNTWIFFIMYIYCLSCQKLIYVSSAKFLSIYSLWLICDTEQHHAMSELCDRASIHV